MKLLLDTHIWIWSVAEPERLSSRVRDADRFLAATAKVLELTLVTADGRLAGSREFAVLSN